MKRAIAVNAKPPRHDQMRGFSLLDVAIVIGIVGLIVSGFLASYKLYQTIRANAVTEENFQTVQMALGAYKAINARYPVPMGYGLSEADDEYGLSSTNTGSCSGTPPKGRVCSSTDSGQTILIGLIPFAELNIAPAAARDGYGRLFTYAISERQTQAGGNDPAFRDICVRSQDIHNDGSVQEVDCSTPADQNPRVEVVLISHGRDGVGAWLPSGSLYKACGPEPGDGGIEPAQKKNCDYDHVFVRASRTNKDNAAHAVDPVLRQPIILRADGAGKNDDIIKTEIREDTNYWNQLTANTNARISNVNAYKVGIGTNTPEAPLHVDGNVRADSILAEEMCADATTCLTVGAIADDLTQMECSDSAGNPTGMVKEISNNEVTCRYVVEPADCAAHQYVNGFDADGQPICADMPAACGPAHNRNDGSPPPAGELCYNGTAGAVAGAGPWTWRCTLGTQAANCTKN